MEILLNDVEIEQIMKMDQEMMAFEKRLTEDDELKNKYKEFETLKFEDYKVKVCTM